MTIKLVSAILNNIRSIAKSLGMKVSKICNEYYPRGKCFDIRCEVDYHVGVSDNMMYFGWYAGGWAQYWE